MAGLLVIGVFFFFILWLIFAPFYIKINSSQQNYSAGLTGILKIRIIPDETEILILKANIFFIPFKIYLFRGKKPKKLENLRKVKPKKKRSFTWENFNFFAPVVWKIIKSFKLKKLEIDIDTDDITANSWLIPVFVLINRRHIDLRVNFNGDLRFNIYIQNRIFNILIIVISGFMKHQFNRLTSKN